MLDAILFYAVIIGITVFGHFLKKYAVKLGEEAMREAFPRELEEDKLHGPLPDGKLRTEKAAEDALLLRHPGAHATTPPRKRRPSWSEMRTFVNVPTWAAGSTSTSAN